jgi:hypothetical protein
MRYNYLFQRSRKRVFLPSSCNRTIALPLETQKGDVEKLVLMAINLLLGLAALAGIVWDISTGQIGSMDGNFLAVVCLLLALIFLGGFISSLRSGDLKQIFQKKQHKGTDTTE